MTTWGLFGAFVVLFALYVGTRDWKTSGGLNYTFRAFLRISFIILLSFYDYGFEAEYTAGAFKLACYRYLIFWISFDILVNMVHFRNYILRGKLQMLFHLGSSALLDAIFRLAWAVPMNFTYLTHPDFLHYHRHRRNLIGAVITQYVFKTLLFIVTFQWYNFTPETDLFSYGR